MDKKTNVNPIYWMNMIALMTLFLYCSAGGFEASAVQTCFEAWPEVSKANIRLMFSLPTLAQASIMLISGPLIGKRISFRAAAITGMFLISLGGCIPFFYYPNWNFVLFVRSIGLGCGSGLLGMRNALLLNTVTKEEEGKWIGYGSSVIAFSSVLFSPIAGMLASIGWNYSFLVNAGAIPCLLLVTLFLKEPETRIERTTSQEGIYETSENSTTRLDSRVYLYAVLLFIATCLIYTIVLGISTIFVETGLGGPALSGVCISIYSISGIVINVFLDKLIRKFGRYLLGLCCFVWAFGVVLLLFVHTLPAAIIGLVICGIGYFPVFSLIQLYNGQIQPKDKLAFSSMIILIGNQLAVFASVFYIQISDKLFHYRGSEVASSYLFSLIILIILGICGMKFSIKN